jgi:hypothetical protein
LSQTSSTGSGREEERMRGGEGGGGSRGGGGARGGSGGRGEGGPNNRDGMPVHPSIDATLAAVAVLRPRGSRVYGARFRQKFTLEDAIGSHAFAPLEASRRVTNGIPPGCSLFALVHTVNCIQTLKGHGGRT